MKKSFDNTSKINYTREVSIFYFLKNITMADKNTNISQATNRETEKSNPNTKNTKGKLATLMASVTLSASLIINPASATDKVSNSATIVADGDIDKSKKLIQINHKISTLEKQIDIVKQKKDYKLYYELLTQKKSLDKERDAIRDKFSQRKKETIAIGNKEENDIDKQQIKANETIKNQNETIKSKINEIKKMLVSK